MFLFRPKALEAVLIETWYFSLGLEVSPRCECSWKVGVPGFESCHEPNVYYACKGRSKTKGHQFKFFRHSAIFQQVLFSSFHSFFNDESTEAFPFLSELCYFFTNCQSRTSFIFSCSTCLSYTKVILKYSISPESKPQNLLAPTNFSSVGVLLGFKMFSIL